MRAIVDHAGSSHPMMAGAEAIVAIEGHEILDSRGRPTVAATVRLRGGAQASASVPSGASTGRHEALERRDGDTRRYGGLGVRGAVQAIVEEIAPALLGRQAALQLELDQRIVELDGTADKSRLGANAMLAVSLGIARVAALARGVELWRHLAGQRAPVLPMPMINMISGGAHARGGLDFQDLLAIPVGASSFAEALEMCVAVRDSLSCVLDASGMSTLKADEGGFGPRLTDHDEAFALLIAALEHVGLRPGEQVAFACDMAASQFYDEREGLYLLSAEKRALDAAGLVEFVAGLLERYPIVSIEDPLAEDDWAGWKLATEALGDRVQLLGDDLFVTNPTRLARGIAQRVANAVLVKMNQIGTVSETLAVVDQAQACGYATVVSARSGETEDAALADLAVATAAGQIKVGSVAQSDRLAKYNRLLLIEEELAADARFAGPQALARWRPG